MATKAELEQRVLELEAEIQGLLQVEKAPEQDLGYVKVLESLLDDVELRLPRAFDGFGWRNYL